MKTKTIIAIALLVFVFTSIAYLIAKELRALAQSGSARTCPPAATKGVGPCCEEVVFAKPPTKSSQKVVVYYFHNNFRCAKCRKFESYSDEVLRSAFSDALNDGSLEWKIINIDEPMNKHFVSDYQLLTKSIVVAKMQDGKQTEWKNLNKIWELVGNKAVFVKYIQDEVNAYLGAD